VLRRAVLGTLALGAVLGGLYGLAVVPDPSGGPPYLRVLEAASWNLGYGILALLVAWRGAAEGGVLWAGWFLALMAAESALDLAGVARNAPPFAAPLFYALGALTYGVGVRFTQRFPRPLDARRLQMLRGRASRIARRPAAALLRPAYLAMAVVVMEVVQHGLFPEASVVWHVLVYAALASFYLAAGLKLGTEEDRRRAFWILEGVLIYLVLEGLWTGVLVGRSVLGLGFGMAGFTRWLTAAEGAASLACFAVAIFYFGAFDSGLVVRRTLVFSVLSGLALVLIVALEELAANVLARTTGVGAGAGALVGGVVAALAFRPLAERLDRFFAEGKSRSRGEEDAGLA